MSKKALRRRFIVSVIEFVIEAVLCFAMLSVLLWGLNIIAYSIGFGG